MVRPMLAICSHLHASAVALAVTAMLTAQQPSAVVPGAVLPPYNVVHAGNALHMLTVPGGGAILYHRSVDGGRTFQPARQVATAPSHASFGTYAELVGFDGTLLFSVGTPAGPAVVVSTDGGTTWSAPIQITAQPRTPNSARLFLTSGVVLAVWTEARIGLGDVYASWSFDLGATWTSDVRLDTGPNDADSQWPTVFGDVGHAVYVTWSEFSQPAQTHVRQFQVTFDLGASWLPTPTRLPGLLWITAANGPIVSALGAGNPTLMSSLDYGTTWQPTTFQPGTGLGQNPFIAMDGSNGIAVWIVNFATVFTATTRDFGVTWSPNPLDPQLAIASIPNFLAINGRGAVVNGNAVVVTIIYSTVSGFRDTKVVLSADLGATWREMSFTPAPNWIGEIHVQPHLSERGLQVLTVPNSLHVTTVCGYQPYGTATPGSGGIVPRLDGEGIPILGNRIAWNVSQCMGGAPVVLGLSFAGPAALPVSGITLALAPPLELFGGISTGPVGVAGAGSASFGFLLPDLPVLVGLRTNWQAAVLDVGAPLGLAATAGVEMFTN